MIISFSWLRVFCQNVSFIAVDGNEGGVYRIGYGFSYRCFFLFLRILFLLLPSGKDLGPWKFRGKETELSGSSRRVRTEVRLVPGTVIRVRFSVLCFFCVF